MNLNGIDAEDPEISDYQFLPDTPKLADRLKACLQEGDEIPRDFTKLFEHSLYKLDNALVPKVSIWLLNGVIDSTSSNISKFVR